MATPDKLYKTTVVIWTDYDPAALELEDLAREATSGDAFCSSQETEEVSDKTEFPGTEFFGVDETSNNTYKLNDGSLTQDTYLEGRYVCKFCGSNEVSYNQQTNDAYCAACGEWQNENEA